MQSHPTAHPQIDSEFYVCMCACNVGTISIMRFNIFSMQIKVFVQYKLHLYFLCS
jgi:hypothetical protein